MDQTTKNLKIKSDLKKKKEERNHRALIKEGDVSIQENTKNIINHSKKENHFRKF
jgi:hypothetical protein